ncbi:hypothetical protein EVAR_39860_1 [Eumeta japonica]|uniref:Uncharacterized protein n=1 Tax=Eumeta variegata TaxID=151549 RepID=A0A4C1WQE7_EUMVA|nr:hypothetical protein EVAR_39860_1 [Eumeta japonica]
MRLVSMKHKYLIDFKILRRLHGNTDPRPSPPRALIGAGGGPSSIIGQFNSICASRRRSEATRVGFLLYHGGRPGRSRGLFNDFVNSYISGAACCHSVTSPSVWRELTFVADGCVSHCAKAQLFSCHETCIISVSGPNADRALGRDPGSALASIANEVSQKYAYCPTSKTVLRRIPYKAINL